VSPGKQILASPPPRTKTRTDIKMSKVFLRPCQNQTGRNQTAACKR
jgi:hypothetical protein